MAKNAIVGQSGGPTAVINASLAGVFAGCKQGGADTVYGMCNGIQGLLDERIVDLSDKLPNEEALELLKRTPASYLGSCRYKLPPSDSGDAVYGEIFRILEKLDIAYFFYIGGNDSMDTICKLSDYGAAIGSPIRFMGVPKTIDNVLSVTELTPGYGSAAIYMATVVKELVRDSTIYDMRSVTIVEIMGRNAGWLTAAAALAAGEDCEGADMIFLPETPFDVDDFIARVDAAQKTRPSLLVAVSEGITLADGRYVCELAADEVKEDVFGHKNLTGTAQYLAERLSRAIGTKTRAVELSTLQRCASHLASATDIEEAFAVGAAAAAAALDGHTGEMIALKRLADAPYRWTTEPHDVHAVANLEKTVPLDWIDAEHATLRPAFIDYARPLIQDELPPMYKSGLPRHIVL